VVQGDVEIARVAGNHFSMMRRPHVQRLAGHLKAALEGADGAG
jgi:thioesterase domain-containing protein